MSSTRPGLLLIFLLCLKLATAQSTPQKADFYVSPTGNDRAAGTVEAPFVTVDRARRAVQENRSHHKGSTVVMLRGGTYFLAQPLQFSAADSGSADAPIIYKAYPQETPVISGGRQIANWKVASGRWTTTIDPSFAYFEQLFVNEQRRYRPRTTKRGYLYNEGPVLMNSGSEGCKIYNQKLGGYECFDRFRFKAGDLAANYANINDVEIDDFEKWTMSKLRLQSVDPSSGVAYLTGPTFQNANNGFIQGHRYLVENVKEALSEPGEWYLDRSTSPWALTYIPKSGEKPESTVVIAPQQAQLIAANSLSYVTFEGISFAHDNWVVPANGHQSFQAEPFVPAALSFASSHHIHFDHCTIAHTGVWGIEFETGDNGPSFNNEVTNNVLYDLGAGGIRIGTQHMKSDSEDSVSHDNLVQNNLIAAGGRVLPAGIGMGVFIGNSPNNTVTHNEIYDTYGGGIGVCVPIPAGCPFPHDNTISFNHVYRQGEGLISDFAGIYLATYKTTGNRVINNWVHDVTHAYTDPDGYNGIGIYLDNITSNVQVANNLVYRASQSDIFNNRGANNTWTNNILAYGMMGIVQLGGMPPRMRGMNQQGQRRPGMGGGGFGGMRRRPWNGPGPGNQGGGGGGMQREQADPNQPALIFTHNLVLFGKGAIQKTPGFWLCTHPENGSEVPCFDRFRFDENLYWNLDRKQPEFTTSDPQNPRNSNPVSWSNWQGLGEDVHSINEDPRFVNPRADDFSLRSGSPASKIGFQSFDPKQAGLSSPLPRPPEQPPAFPTQLLNPESDF